MNYGKSRLFSPSRCAVLLLAVAFAIPVFGQQQQPVIYDGRPAVPEEILIRLRSSDPAALVRARSAAPFAVIEQLNPGLAIHLVRAPGNSLAGLVQAFSNQPDVLYAEPNYIMQAVNTIPNDASFSLLWGLTQTSAPTAWDITTGGTSVVVGIIDSGISYTHPDLVGNVWNAPTAFTVTIAGHSVNCPAGSHGFNAITLSCDPLDDFDHGSHVSGTIGARGNNSIGVAGVNWRAQMMGLKFLNSAGNGSTANAISAIEFAIQVKALFANTSTPVNVRVLSNSWGGSGFSQSLLDEVNRANSNEMLFVAAAGNDTANNDTTAFYPASFSTLAPNVIAVAATDSADGLASFSNYGATTVQLGAPGVGIYSTIRNGSYGSFSGTSMATPHVSGAALLTLTACPSLTTAALKNAILANVDPVPSLSGKTVTGGRLNINKTVRSCAVIASTLKATYLGATGQDFVGPGGQTTSNGTADWHLQLQGLRGTPTKVRISSTVGGTWEAPFNGTNWIIATQYGGGGTGDLFFEPWSTPGFHVKVWYPDSSTDEVDSTPGTVSSTLKATFLDTGTDHVGPNGQLTPNGVADWQVRLQGLRGTPTKVHITSAGGEWESPYNGVNWVIFPQYGAGGTGDLWFEPWSAPGFHVKVWYSDATTDEIDATNGSTPGTLRAVYLGVTGQDFVGPNGQLTPNGTADWHIQLQGLTGTPTKVQVTSAGGIWEGPYNGVNWVILPQYGAGGTGDLWFEPWSTPGFHVKVWYSDETTDEIDAT